jgi:hypothetical protein
MGKESDLYNPYNTKTLGGDTRLDVSTYENVQDSINVEKVNRQLLELTDLIGRVTNNRSNSGPIPNTSINVTGSTGSSGSGNDVELYQPAKGEVWAIQGLGIENNATGNPTIYAFLEDAAGVRCYFVVDGVGGSPWSSDDEFGAPIYVDSNMSFRFYAFLSGGFGTGESATVTANLIRVR